MVDWPKTTVGDSLEPLVLQKMPKVLSRDYKSTGSFPIVDQGQRLIAGWTDDESGLISTHLPVVVFGDHTRAFKYVDFPFVRGADGTQVLKPKAGIDPLFFYYACRAIELPSRGYNRHFKALKEREIAIPPLQEQRSIARALRQIDDALSVQDEQLQTGLALKRAAMHTLFTCGLRGEAQKETEIGPVPESWKLVNFASVRENLQYGTSVRCTYDVSERPVLRIPNIEPQRVTADDLKYCTLTGNDAAKYQLEDGDLVFIRTNGVLDRLGSCAVYNGYPANALFASYLIRARVKPDYVVPHFAASFFGSEMGTSIVAGRAISASDGKFNLNTAAIDSLLLPLPPTLSEQREIVAVLDAIGRKIDLHRRKRAVLEELFKALLHKLMTGEVRVGDLGLSRWSKQLKEVD